MQPLIPPQQKRRQAIPAEESSRPEKASIEPLQALNAALGRLAARVSPAVVHIHVESYQRAEAQQEAGGEKIQMLTKQRSAGSGVIVDPDGYILTALRWPSQCRTSYLWGVCAPRGLLPLERPGLACAEDTTF